MITNETWRKKVISVKQGFNKDDYFSLK